MTLEGHCRRKGLSFYFRDCTDSHQCGGDTFHWGYVPVMSPECEFLDGLGALVSLTVPCPFQQDIEHLGFQPTPPNL